jgi:Fe2+-dicitrate sensor, membrane component
MDSQRLQQLLVKFKCNTLSTKEWKELQSLITNGLLDKELLEHISFEWNREHVHYTWDKNDAVALWQKIAGTIEQQDASFAGNSAPLKPLPVKKHNHSFIYMYRWWLAGAAMLLFAVGTVALYQFYPKKQGYSISSSIKNDVLPGHKAAILKLDDGSVINIDSVPPGIIATQGGLTIIKKENGELVYEGNMNGKILYNEVSTLNGQELNIYLPDGTQVFLNASSSIRYPLTFAEKERLVTMTGEAYFNVKHSDTKPFKIQLHDQIIEDLGTEFNVNAYSDEPNIKTTLIRGSVKITQSGNSVLLKPNQQAITNNSKPIQVVYAYNIDQIIAWKEGYFSFKDDSIEEIMKQIARWYDVKVVYKGKKVQELFIADVPRNISLSRFLKILESTGWVKFEVNGKKVTVTGNG